MGAAYLAGLAVGYWKNVDEIKQQWKLNKAFKPDTIKASQLIKGWDRAVRAAKVWAGE
jgi:glycerol kinase